MRKFIWLLTLVFLGLAASTQATKPKPAGNAETDGIQFTDAAWKDVLKKAKAEKKVIFLDAYASWCQPCKLLQKHVFTKRSVGELYNARFINVKIDMEKGEGPALSQVYPLEAYPTLLFIDGNGRVLRKVVGLQTPENLLAIGRSIRTPDSYGRSRDL